MPFIVSEQMVVHDVLIKGMYYESSISTSWSTDFLQKSYYVEGLR